MKRCLCLKNSSHGNKNCLINQNFFEKEITQLRTAQRRRLIKLMQELIAQLEKDPIPVEIEYNGEVFRGDAMPVSQTCHDGVCDELDVTLNDEHIGIIKCTKAGGRWMAI